MQEQDWLPLAVDNWPVAVGFSLVFLVIFLWILAPFALFGIKKRLDRMTRILEDIRDDARSNGGRKPDGRAEKEE